MTTVLPYVIYCNDTFMEESSCKTQRPALSCRFCRVAERNGGGCGSSSVQSGLGSENNFGHVKTAGNNHEYHTND